MEQNSTRVCQCGVTIRTPDTDWCSRCRKKGLPEPKDEPRLLRGWVRLGMVWHPVFEEERSA